MVGHIYRYNTDQLSWTAKSSEFLEKKSLRWGSMMFHIGILLVFAGHVVGLLIPKTWTEALGISNHVYHMTAVVGGGIAGFITFVGIMILLTRRLSNRRVRSTTQFSDMLTIIMIFLIVFIGLYNTFIGNQLHPNFDYRDSISPWIRGFFSFHPDAQLMQGVPLGFQLHILLSFAIFGIWPFTRLVHVWSVPIAYFKRSYILYRKKA